jgi:hypothetical protein
MTKFTRSCLRVQAAPLVQSCGAWVGSGRRDLLLRRDMLPLLVVGWLMVLTAVDWFEVRIA